MNTMNAQIKRIQADLYNSVLVNFELLKKRYGTTTDTDTIRVIINEHARLVKEQRLDPFKAPSESAEVVN